MVKYTNLQSLRYRSTGNAHHMMTVVNTVSLRVKLKILRVLVVRTKHWLFL